MVVPVRVPSIVQIYQFKYNCVQIICIKNINLKLEFFIKDYYY